MSSHRRILKNTVFLYLRMILTMGVSLYTVRVVLDVLGIEDFGIYHVVGGLVALFSFLSAAMASASQRYFSHALGENNPERLKQVFAVNLGIYGAICLIALLGLETVGLWFVSHQLNIPESRLGAAVIIYHFTVCTFIFKVLCTPLTAMLIAHEDMHIYASLSIIDALLRLAAAFALIHVGLDKMVLYGGMMMLVSLTNVAASLLVCRKKYAECRFNDLSWEKSLASEMLSFTGWSLFGAITSISRSHGITVLLNQFFSPAIVAARVIAVNLSAKANLFASNFNIGLYPSIIKSYAANEREQMNRLIFNGCKISFFLILLMALPLCVEMKSLLEIWLKEVPAYAVLFSQLALIESFLIAISTPLATAARAPGKMALYEGTLGSIQLLSLLLAWLALVLGHGPESVFIVVVAINVLMYAVRLILLRKILQLPIKRFSHEVLLPSIIVLAIAGSGSQLCATFRPDGILWLLASLSFTAVLAVFATYLILLNTHERAQMKRLAVRKFPKLTCFG